MTAEAMSATILGVITRLLVARHRSPEAGPGPATPRGTPRSLARPEVRVKEPAGQRLRLRRILTDTTATAKGPGAGTGVIERVQSMLAD